MFPCSTVTNLPFSPLVEELKYILNCQQEIFSLCLSQEIQSQFTLCHKIDIDFLNDNLTTFLMTSEITKPQINLCNDENNNCLRFSFKGSFVEEEVKKAVAKWKQVFKTNEGKKLNLVRDCNKMTGYDPGARLVWQHALEELKDQISSIWLVSKSSMIRSGAMIISMITKHNIKVVKFESEIMFS